MVTAVQIPESDHASLPSRKRPRPDSAPTVEITKKTPRLFVPFRALGLVTNHIPFQLQTRSFKGATDGPRVHILTCLGRAWAIWEGGKMGLLFVGPDTQESISSMTFDVDAVCVASGAHIIRYIRGKEVRRFTNPLGSNLSFVTVLGPSLLALTDAGDRMLVWDTETGEVDTSIQFGSKFTATSILHPATYLNKVLVASNEGSMQLWNIRSRMCIYTFTVERLLSLPDVLDDSTKGHASAISALAQSPAIDVVGVGFASGEISVYDVRADERLMRMFMEGRVRALGFRIDGEPILASASSSGNIALWDLNSGGRLLHLMRGAHDGAITAVEWIPGQPVLISSGEDNSVKQWFFESPTAQPRLLKFRSGHHAPPHLIRYYGEDGKQLLTASRDRSLRCTSVVRDSRSFELSQGSLTKKATTLSIPVGSLKFPPVTAISYSTARSKDWDDIVTAHTDESLARTWTMMNKKLGKHTLGITDGVKRKGKERSFSGSVKSVCVTACGNFGLAGSSTGQILMWNLQSGIQRKSYNVGSAPEELAQSTQAKVKKQSERPIVGLATDPLNRLVIAGTLDGSINFFDFQTTKLEYTLVLPSFVASILLHRDSGLLAAICDDMTVRVVDIETRRVVRELGSFRGRILDMTFSPDSRWLVTTSMDSIIRTFDLPTGRVIDAFRISSLATSISFSPTNDFLATSHVDSVGVFLWANRAQYADVAFSSVSNDDIDDITLPSMQGVAEDDVTDALSSLGVRDTHVDVFSTPQQLDGELVTLTLLPRTKWQTLLNLEVIQQRNKPKEPPRAPEKAPFFLPTLPGVEPRFAPQAREAPSETKKTSRRLEKVAANSESVFYQKLIADDVSGDNEALFSFAKTLSPAAIELELRSIMSLESLKAFIRALTRRLKSHRDFEAVQAFQTVFLRIHGDVIVANPELQALLSVMMEVQKSESRRVLELIASSLGTLSFVRDVL